MEGIVLSARKHGESAAIVTLLTRAHGRHLGLAHGGGSATTRSTSWAWRSPRRSRPMAPGTRSRLCGRASRGS
ncbi:MAG: recombination protein O N-terminal domain-containing protein [Proteobacteria bacterium]|nr:recombination protein O N-terminal domain-containing protein [Pseudomonadota bacterium]